MADDAEEELRRRAQAEQATAREEAERRSEAARKARAQEARRTEQKRARDRFAPAGFFRSMRFFWLAAAALVMLVILGVMTMEGDLTTHARYLAPVAVLWLIAFTVLWFDAATWRKRLPFPVEGDLVIEGEDRTGDSEVPWIAVTVEIVLAQAASHEALRHTLEVLASQANRLLVDDKEARFGGEKVWRADAAQASGQTDPSFWTTRLLERWLRNEVRLLHQVAPISRVKVHARYTGAGYHISTD